MNFALRTNDDMLVYDLLKLTVNRPGIAHYAGRIMPIVEAGSARLETSFVTILVLGFHRQVLVPAVRGERSDCS